MVIGVDVEIVIWNRNIGLGYQVNDFGLVWSRVSASDEYELNCVQAKSGWNQLFNYFLSWFHVNQLAKRSLPSFDS